MTDDKENKSVDDSDSKGSDDEAKDDLNEEKDATIIIADINKVEGAEDIPTSDGRKRRNDQGRGAVFRQ